MIVPPGLRPREVLGVVSPVADSNDAVRAYRTEGVHLF
jgi:hypothetical protein